MSTTPRKGLVKVAPEDAADFDVMYNPNMDKLDDTVMYDENETITGTWTFDTPPALSGFILDVDASGYVKNDADGNVSGGNSILVGELPTGIPSTNIGLGTVDNTEFSYLDGVTSSIQTQLGTKSNTTDVILRDGSAELTSDWDIGSGNTILADTITARNASGIVIGDENGVGITVASGEVTIDTLNVSTLSVGSLGYTIVELVYDSDISCDTTLGDIYTLTTTGNCTINAVGGRDGQRIKFIITDDSTGRHRVTFGTGFTSLGTLVGIADTTQSVEFTYDGSTWLESERIERGIYNVTHYGAVGDGSTNDYTAISNAVTAAGTNTIYFPTGTYKIGSDITIGTTCIFDRGAMLSPDNTKVVTITGDITAPNYQIFTGNGTISLLGNYRLSVVYAEWWGAVADGTTDCQASIQKALTALGTRSGGILQLLSGTYLVNSESTLSSYITIRGNGNTIIKNGISSALGTLDAIFKADDVGRVTNSGTITAEMTEGKLTITVSNIGNFAIDDVICIYSGKYTNFSIVNTVTVGTSTLTLDRPAVYTGTSGSTIYKVNTYKNIVIENLHIDFNGTRIAPRYGYGFLGYFCQNCHIRNITANDIGSKVVEFYSSLDCKVSNITANYATNITDGGHGYLCRISLGNDCIVENCTGQDLRHLEDCSGSSRCIIRDCTATNCLYGAFLTHSNSAKKNLFINNKVLGGVGYFIGANSGDTDNVIEGGYLENAVFIRYPQTKTTKITNVTYTSFASGGQYGLQDSGTFIISNCNFTLGYPLISWHMKSTSANYTFINCTFNVNVIRGIANLTSDSYATTIRFINCVIDSSDYAGRIIDGRDTTIIFDNCRILAKDDAINNPLFYTKTSIEARNSVFEFPTSGYSFFGLEDVASLYVDGCTFINASNIVRKYTNDVSIIFGKNTYTNSSWVSLLNYIGLTTRGLGYIKATTAPTTGSWLAGAKIANEGTNNLIDSWVCTTDGTPGTWATIVRSSTSTGIVASTTQIQGYGTLTSTINQVAVCANPSDVVTLPDAYGGSTISVMNSGPELLQIFPASGDILGTGSSASVLLPSGNAKMFQAYDSTTWMVFA